MVILIRWAIAATVMAARYPKVALGILGVAIVWSVSPLGALIGLGILLVMYQIMGKPRPSGSSMATRSPEPPA